MTSKGNHVKFARFVFLPSVKKQKHEFNFFRSMYNKTLLDSVFVISRIIKVSVRVISLSLRLRLKTLILTLIILDITKTSSNNCLVTNRATKQTYHNPKLLYTRENKGQRGKLPVQPLGYVNSTKVIYGGALERKYVFRDVCINADLDLMFLVKAK